MPDKESKSTDKTTNKNSIEFYLQPATNEVYTIPSPATSTNSITRLGSAIKHPCVYSSSVKHIRPGAPVVLLPTVRRKTRLRNDLKR